MSFIFLKKEAHYTIVVNMANRGCQDFFSLTLCSVFEDFGFFLIV